MFYCFKPTRLSEEPKSQTDPRASGAVLVGCPLARPSRQNGHLDAHAFAGTRRSPGMELKRGGSGALRG